MHDDPKVDLPSWLEELTFNDKKKIYDLFYWNLKKEATKKNPSKPDHDDDDDDDDEYTLGYEDGRGGTKDSIWWDSSSDYQKGWEDGHGDRLMED